MTKPTAEPLSAEEEAALRVDLAKYPVSTGMALEPHSTLTYARRLLATLDAARQQAAADARRDLDEERTDG